MSPYTTASTDETLIADTDTGDITILLFAGIEKTAYRIINAGTSGNNLTITPNGTENLYGSNESEVLIDQEHLDMQYTNKGWV